MTTKRRTSNNKSHVRTNHNNNNNNNESQDTVNSDHEKVSKKDALVNLLPDSFKGLAENLTEEQAEQINQQGLSLLNSVSEPVSAPVIHNEKQPHEENKPRKRGRPAKTAQKSEEAEQQELMRQFIVGQFVAFFAFINKSLLDDEGLPTASETEELTRLTYQCVVYYNIQLSPPLMMVGFLGKFYMMRAAAIKAKLSSRKTKVEQEKTNETKDNGQ